MSDLTDLQERILEAKRDDPAASPQEIADSVDCSEGYARDVLDEYDTAILESEPSKTNDKGGPSLIPILLIILLIVGGFVIENGLGPIPPLG